MNPIITNIAFVGKYMIPNPTDVLNAAQIRYVIDTNQEIYLRELLGPLLYNDFSAWFDSSPRTPNTTYEQLLTGATFESLYDKIDCYMPPISRPITAFCYCAYNDMIATQTVAMGEVKTNSQNAIQDSANIKVLDRWNEMVSDSIATWAFLNKNLNNDTKWTSYRDLSKRDYISSIYTRKNRLDL